MLIHQGHNSRSNNNYNAFTYCNVAWSAHFHKNFEVLCVIKGSLILNVNDRTEVLRAGEYALVLSNQIHSFTVDSGSMVWVAVFSEDFVPEFASYIKNKQGSRLRFAPTEEVAELFMREMIMGEPSPMMRRACLYAICDAFCKAVTTEARKTKNDDLICRVLDYVEAHFREDLSLSRVAEEFGYEYHYLSRLLNQKYNIRFCNILNEYRVEAAAQALTAGEESITDIAFASGFQSIRAFNDVFAELKGVSPAMYRAGEEDRTKSDEKGFSLPQIVKKM